MQLSRFLLVAAGFAAGGAQAFDVTLASGVRTSYVGSQLTSTPFDDRLLLAAHDDAASFVASDGAIRGVRLEAALSRLRRLWPGLASSDAELARFILVSSDPSFPVSER